MNYPSISIKAAEFKKFKLWLHSSAGIDLINTLPDIGKFNIIFLRNAMIYFDNEMRTRVVDKIVDLLKSGGYLFVSHSESLVGINTRLKIVQPSILIES